MTENPLKGKFLYPEEDMEVLKKALNDILEAQEPAKVAAMMAPTLLLIAGGAIAPKEGFADTYEEFQDKMNQLLELGLIDYARAVFRVVGVSEDEMDRVHTDAIRTVARVSGALRNIASQYTDFDEDNIEDEAMKAVMKNLTIAALKN